VGGTDDKFCDGSGCRSIRTKALSRDTSSPQCFASTAGISERWRTEARHGQQLYLRQHLRAHRRDAELNQHGELHLRSRGQSTQFAGCFLVHEQFLERADLNLKRDLYLRFEWEFADESGGVEHHKLRVGLREPHDQRDFARKRGNRDVRVRSIRPSHQESYVQRHKHLRL